MLLPIGITELNRETRGIQRTAKLRSKSLVKIKCRGRIANGNNASRRKI
jgi:hypothetical protein